MSEGANREELDHYARPTPPPKIYYQLQHVKVSEYIIFMLYVFHCLQTFLLFSDTLN